MAGFDQHIDVPELERLIKACIDQQPLAQRRMYECYYAFVKGICLRYTSKVEDCEEVMDDAFLKMFRNLDKYNAERPFKAWLRTIVVNTAIDYYRQSLRSIMSNSIDDHPNLSIAEQTLADLSTDDIMKAVQKLSPGYRTVFMMYVVDGYNHKEIAEMLNITEGTSKSNLSKARMKMQELLLSMYKNELSPHLMKYTLPSNL